MMNEAHRSIQIGKYPDLNRGPHMAIIMLIGLLAVFLLAAFLWMYFGTLSISIHAMGKVVPSSKVQNVQSFEGGILRELLVKEGQPVKQNDVVARVENLQFHSQLGESRQNYWSMLASSERLKAELNGHQPDFPVDVSSNAPEIVQRERNLFFSRVQEHNAALDTAKRQLEQRQQELVEAQSKLKNLGESLSLAQESLAMETKLAEEKVGARADYLNAQDSVTKLQGELRLTKAAIPRLNAAVKEGQSRINETESTYQSDAKKQLNEYLEKIAALKELMTSMQDKVSRSELRAPMSGVVNRILINTLGGVVQPGENVMEIVPIEDKLLIAVKVKPSDMAFIHLEQSAQVRITAYDSSIFGALNAKVVKIGVDAILDERKENTYFEVTLETDRNYVGEEKEKLMIIPGMVADASIKTGQRTVLEYLLKPIVKTFRQALQER